MVPDHEGVCRSIADRVAAIASDPVLRRALRYEPARVLAAWAAGSPAPTGSLGVHHWDVPDFDPAAAWGDPAAEASYGVDVPVELRLLRSGIRPAVLVHGPSDELSRHAVWARQRGFFALLSPWTVEPVPDPARGGFSDLSGPRAPAVAGRAGGRALLVTADPSALVLGWLALLHDWDDYLGLVLGYPRCCAAAFPERWRRAQESAAGDVAQLLLRDHEPGEVEVHWTCNVFARVLGLPFPAHFPCRLDCPETRTLVSAQLEAFACVEPLTAAAIVTGLQAPLHVSPSRATRPAGQEPVGDGWLISPGGVHEVPVVAAV